MIFLSIEKNRKNTQKGKSVLCIFVWRVCLHILFIYTYCLHILFNQCSAQAFSWQSLRNESDRLNVKAHYYFNHHRLKYCTSTHAQSPVSHVSLTKLHLKTPHVSLKHGSQGSSVTLFCCCISTTFTSIVSIKHFCLFHICWAGLDSTNGSPCLLSILQLHFFRPPDRNLTQDYTDSHILFFINETEYIVLQFSLNWVFFFDWRIGRS